MVSYSRRLFSNAVVPYQVAKNWVRKNGYMLSKALEFHESNNHISLFTDVPYDHLVKDSMEVIKHIYEDRQESISPELLKVFMEANRSNPQGKYGVHKYELSDFGIDENYIDQYTSAYQQFQRSTLK
jgi:hypothetical protein